MLSFDLEGMTSNDIVNQRIHKAIILVKSSSIDQPNKSITRIHICR